MLTPSRRLLLLHELLLLLLLLRRRRHRRHISLLLLLLLPIRQQLLLWCRCGVMLRCVLIMALLLLLPWPCRPCRQVLPCGLLLLLIRGLLQEEVVRGGVANTAALQDLCQAVQESLVSSSSGSSKQVMSPHNDVNTCADARPACPARHTVIYVCASLSLQHNLLQSTPAYVTNMY
jgi:hypothetical protein